MSYKVKIDIFEGPFDLLVYLIENAEMNIYDIQVSEITKQYLEYVERMRDTDVGIATEFMVLAAALIEIKSKMLLPRTTNMEDGVVEEDPRTELVEKILEYKKFKAAAEALEQKEELRMQCFEKPKEDLTPYTNETDEFLCLDIKQFVASFNLFLRKKQRIEEVRKHYTRVERQKLSIETKIEHIVGFFRNRGLKRMLFKELLTKESDTYDVVITFASMLEMIRQRLIKVEQKAAFDEIEIEMGEAANDH
ncbi:segregation and condensation protein A [Clostridium aminobutyricum]|uniref:Segregation and condensation protein A n=1 Tax=Clostridium aminobutyricum TaxID=33953 RepID=A0A939D8I9_CLOAM|nr:segregation/condensation protein A [Clostridium aminobutyricum]MBN7773060.1 segregation/condensation protein A [Clostridium aminobutyricum]